jgi:hypothetical protein
MGIEMFWAIVCWAVVIGIGLLTAFVGYYWFVAIPDRVHPRAVEDRPPGAVHDAAWR